jgi:glutaredoxin
MKSFFLLVLSLLSFSVFAEQMYKWVDETGKTHYSDQTPPATAKSIQEKNVKGGNESDAQLPYATQMASKKYPVTFYGSSTHCTEVCVKAKQLLSKRGIPFSEKDASDPAEAENLKKLIGALEVPVLVVGDNKIKGFEEGSWQSALDAAGYPKTAVKPFTPPATPKTPDPAAKQ